MNIVLLFDRLINKVERSYRKYIFRKRINCEHNSFLLVGKVHLVNTNVTIGKNVTIYSNVMFWGDGPITIGDNVDIGNGTVICASKIGGNHWQ